MNKNFMPNDFGWTQQDEEKRAFNPNAFHNLWEDFFLLIENAEECIFSESDQDEYIGAYSSQLDIREDQEEMYDWEQGYEEFLDEALIEWEKEEEAYLDELCKMEDSLRKQVRHPNRNLNKVA